MAAEFLPARPKLEPQEDGRTWILLEDFSFRRANGELVTSAAGSRSDLGSVPQVAWSIVPPAGAGLRAFLIHDELYQRHRAGDPTWTREEADQVLLEALHLCQMSDVERHLIFQAVRVGGESAWTGRTHAVHPGGTGPDR